jgi:hypothetical protein
LKPPTPQAHPIELKVCGDRRQQDYTHVTNDVRRNFLLFELVFRASPKRQGPLHQRRIEMTDQEEFVRLSCALTGLAERELPAMVEQQDVDGTPVKLSEIYFERVRSAYRSELSELLAVWRAVQGTADPEAALAQRLATAEDASQRLRIAARQVAKIWFLSTIDDPRRPLDSKGKNSGQLAGDIGQYQQSVIWKLIGAPVPGYSNLPHGYWKDKPTLP